MLWEVEYSDEFAGWWDHLTEDEQMSVNAKVMLLQQYGPALRRPHVGHIVTSRHPNMKELVVQHAGRPIRVLFAFDPRSCGYLIVGGDKTGDDRWYEIVVPRADAIYEQHLNEIKKEKI